uniref:Uncharacterized protein n=1 Tax=Zonotrichia albicollis TaxID=44394 RepID=A0A8D2M4N5_ZONAL
MTIAALHEDNVVQHDEQCFLSLLRVDKPLDSLHEDAEHERSGKDGVAESPQHVCPAEAERAGLVPLDAAEADADQPDDHGDQRIAHVGDRDLNEWLEGYAEAFCSHGWSTRLKILIPETKGY